MMSLLMLGIIPGTDVQITFEEWLVAMLLFIVAASAVFVHRHGVPLVPAAVKSIRQAAQNLRTTARPA